MMLIWLRMLLCSGYDFGYMLKILTSQPLPTDESEFFDLVKMFFPNIYDVKYLMKSCKNLKGGLQEVADQLEVSFCFNLIDCDVLLILMMFFWVIPMCINSFMCWHVHTCFTASSHNHWRLSLFGHCDIRVQSEPCFITDWPETLIILFIDKYFVHYLYI